MRSPGLKFSPAELAILKLVRHIAQAKATRLFLVGGILRDRLLGRRKNTLDLDFTLKRGSINFGRSLATGLGAGFVVLDKRRGACRVVKKTGNTFYTLDFTDFRAKSLESDLRLRDFSINALGLELDAAVFNKDLEEALVDPCSGVADLKRKVIKVVSRTTFDDDPVRILRAFSFSAALDFKIDKQTLKLAVLKRAKLRFPSGERLRDEIFKILDTERAGLTLKAMLKAGVLQVLFPEIKSMRGIGRGGYHHLDVLDHSIETVRQLDMLTKALAGNAPIQNYLNQEISVSRRRLALLKFGAFLHDIGKPAAMRRVGRKLTFYGHERIGRQLGDGIARRLKLSNEEIHSLRKMILWHLRPGYLTNIKEVTARSLFRFFRDTGTEALSVLLLSLADQQATCGVKTTAAFKARFKKTAFGLVDEYFQRQERQEKAVRLINGDDLMKIFKLQPSPLVGKVLYEIEEFQAVGRIKTKRQAIEAAGKIIRKSIRT